MNCFLLEKCGDSTACHLKNLHVIWVQISLFFKSRFPKYLELISHLPEKFLNCKRSEVETFKFFASQLAKRDLNWFPGAELGTEKKLESKSVVLYSAHLFSVLLEKITFGR